MQMAAPSVVPSRDLAITGLIIALRVRLLFKKACLVPTFVRESLTPLSPLQAGNAIPSRRFFASRPSLKSLRGPYRCLY